MAISDQGVSLERYLLVPRTAIFIRRDDQYLLLQGAPDKRLWAGLYNGLGGHIEQGEGLLEAARRELKEEAGLDADLWLCGTLLVDTGENPGVCLFIFTGRWKTGEPTRSREGRARWVTMPELASLPVVEDLPALISRIDQMKPGDVPFGARSYYDHSGKVVVEFDK